MQVDIKLSFDLSDDDEKELYGKVNDVLLEKEDEVEEEDEVDYKGALESVKEKIQEKLDEAKSGSPSEKFWTKAQEMFDEVMSENDVELD